MRSNLRGIALLVVASAAVAAQDQLPPEVLLLAHFKEKIREALSQVPNYTCLETIQRSVRDRHKITFAPQDTVLLEISNVGNKELLAWPGAQRFEDADLTSFASNGMMCSGIFALYAAQVFLSNSTTMKYHGKEEIRGFPAARFDYQVASVWSGFQIQANGRAATVGMTGSFWIDPGSLELLRMDVNADGIPPELGVERSRTVIDYARMQIGDSGVLLPQEAHLLMTLVDGEARQNDIEFSHCHEYRTESSIRFDMPDTSAPAAPPAIRQVNLPAGLTVTIALDAAIDSNTAHVGDLLRGHVTNAVRQKGKAIVIPKDATVTGRVRGLEHLSPPLSGFDLTIEFEEVTWDHARAEFYGEILPTELAQVDNPFISMGGEMPALSINREGARGIRAPQIPGTGVFHMAGRQFRIAPGFRMNWRTREPNQQRKKSR